MAHSWASPGTGTKVYCIPSPASVSATIGYTNTEATLPVGRTRGAAAIRKLVILTEPDYQTCVIESLSALEDALTGPLLNQWETLLESDPTATLFQSPVWCMPWYRAYSRFDPRVIVVSSGDRLTGVVPLAAEKQTGRLTFAGDHIADYKDVVTCPEGREQLLITLLRYIRSAGSGDTFYFGSTHPDSASPALLAKVSRKCGVRTILRINSGWRWWPAEQTEDPLKKKSVRYPINYFKRQGELSAQHIRTPEEWDGFKDEFYRQHTLRLIYGGRVVVDSPYRLVRTHRLELLLEVEDHVGHRDVGRFHLVNRAVLDALQHFAEGFYQVEQRDGQARDRRLRK